MKHSEHAAYVCNIEASVGWFFVYLAYGVAIRLACATGRANGKA